MQLFSEDCVKIGVSVRSAFCSHTDTHTHTHRQTNCNENITPPRFRGGVIKKVLLIRKKILRGCELARNGSQYLALFIVMSAC